FDYPGRRALDEVTFALEEKTITALVGPNGAGKTTLLRCLAGLDTPFAGQVSVAGLDVLSEPRQSHRRMGFLADSFGLYDDLSVEQCLLYRAAALGLPAADRPKAARLAAERLALGDRYRQKVGTLSRGLRQRLAIGETIVHSPDVLLLDEPASGLDPEARLGLAETLRRLRDDGMTIMVSSHILSELEDYSTHMLILRDGRLADQRALAAPSGGTAVMLRLATADARAEAVVKGEGTVSGLIAEGLILRFHFTGDDLARALLLRRLIEAGLPIADFTIERESLQDAYLTHLGDTKALR
ncbi:MAG TPA: ABC transporter ATP-binding protein, partial [Dongiaceae bacterium]